MGARVSRKWARISLSFAMASAAVLVLTAVLGQLLDLGPEGAGWMIGGVLLAGAILYLVLVKAAAAFAPDNTTLLFVARGAAFGATFGGCSGKWASDRRRMATILKQ